MAKAMDYPPDPNAGAPVLDPTRVASLLGPRQRHSSALKKLLLLDAADAVQDLRSPLAIGLSGSLGIAEVSTAFALTSNDAYRFWLNLQSRYELELEKDRLGERLKTEVLVLERAE